MPTDADMAQAGDIIVTAVLDQKNNNHNQLSPTGGSYSLFDGQFSYSIAEDPSWLQGLKDALGRWTGDDDGDGVSNFFDKLHGHDDSIPQIVAPDGSRLAEVAPEVYGLFQASGDRVGPYYQIIGAHFTSGSEISIGFQDKGGSFSFTANGSTTYDLVRVDNPFG